MNPERIVTMDHESERFVPPIEELKYTQRNYLARRVIKPEEVECLKGGEIIDFLNKPLTKYAGLHQHVGSYAPIFNSGAMRVSSAECLPHSESPATLLSPKMPEEVNRVMRN